MTTTPPDKKPTDANPEQEAASPISRRTFIAGVGAVAGAAAAATVAPELVERYLQRNFRELSPERVDALIADLEKTCSAKYGKSVTVSTTPATDGVVFGYGLDLSRCIGCRRCVYACAEENNQSREPQTHWIRVLQMDKDKGIDLSETNAYYDPPEVPDEEHFYVPVQCQQCRRPPCVQSCPVGATWQEPDGIVVIDYDWCIGCRCCMASCPYGARRFNWAEPEVPADELNADTHYLGNRPRPVGVVEKCTFCIQRVREGRYPACVEICPVGARKFGNLLDEESEIRAVMREKRVFVLKEELNTQPKFYYFYG